jgi:hypothetical protein
MAKYGEGYNYAKLLDPSADHIAEPGVIGGKVRVMNDYITIGASNLNSTDYVRVCGQLPKGSQVVDVMLTVVGNLTTESATLVIGDEGDAKRYLISNATSMLTGNKVFFGPNTAEGMYYTVTGVTDNYLRVSGASTVSVISAGTIKVSVMYTVE